MKSDVTVQEQMKELEGLISWFEGDDFVLEQAQEKFQAAEGLAERIREKLHTLKSDITVLKQKFDENDT